MHGQGKNVDISSSISDSQHPIPLLTNGLPPQPLKNINTKVCQICGDTVGVTASGDVFVACNECAFPVCRSCYEYERKEGNQSCPQCKTRYKRHKGSARVAGDDEEDDFDDLDNEFNYVNGNGKSKQQWKMYGRGKNVDISSSISDSQHPIPLLTNGLPPKPLKNINTKVCQICGDTVGVTSSGDVFVACNEFAFPVCRPCYEYERKEGNQSCPQRKTGT